eukprot:170541-Pyramimonas_sp.AAC.2
MSRCSPKSEAGSYTGGVEANNAALVSLYGVNIGLESAFLEVYGVTKGASCSPGVTKGASWFTEDCCGRFGKWNAIGVRNAIGEALGEAISGLPEPGLLDRRPSVSTWRDARYGVISQ